MMIKSKIFVLCKNSPAREAVSDLRHRRETESQQRYEEGAAFSKQTGCIVRNFVEQTSGHQCENEDGRILDDESSFVTPDDLVLPYDSADQLCFEENSERRYLGQPGRLLLGHRLLKLGGRSFRCI